jgi:hypothetical protein
MTPLALRAALLARSDTAPIAAVDDHGERMQAVEALHESSPSDLALMVLAHVCVDVYSATTSLPPIVGGIQRQRLVRWDDYTVTFEGIRIADAKSALVRTLRADRRSPAWRRGLLREHRFMAHHLGCDAEVIESDGLALVLPVEGPRLEEAPPLRDSQAVAACVRLAQWLAQREAAGLEPWAPAPGEARLTPVGPQFFSLSLTDDSPNAAQAIADQMFRYVGKEGPLAEIIAGFKTFPPHHAADWAGPIVQALAGHLAAERHALTHAWRQKRNDNQHARLGALLERLHAFPPPRGEGAVGHDVDGHPSRVISDETSVTWWPGEGPPQVIVDEDGEIQPQAARRLIRARSTTPPSVQPDFVDQLCRWAASAITLRTLRRLLHTTT